MPTITYAVWDAAVSRARLGIPSAELHGLVAGYACAARDGAHDLLEALALECGDAGGADSLRPLLDDVRNDVVRRLDDGEAIEPLLPGTPLPARADAVVDWCRGLLGGLGLSGALGLSGGLGGPAAQTPAVRQALDSLGDVASRHLDCADGDEPALEAVLAFIRSRVAYLHATLAPAERP